MTPDKVKAALDAFSLLAVKRGSGQTEAFSLDMDHINPGDSLILFGPDKAHEDFKTL